MANKAKAELTHTQAMILDVLSPQDCMGLTVRRELEDRGIKLSGPHFYSIVARMEDAGLIEGWWHDAGGLAGRQRALAITMAGLSALTEFTTTGER